MNKRILAGAVLITLVNGGVAVADERDRAVRECKNTIRDQYDVDNFRNVFADRLGHHRFRVYGKVKRGGHRYPFNCTVKRGWVQSYYYDGPHGSWDDEWSDNDYRYRDSRPRKKHHKKDNARNVAIGVGLAAVAAAAVAAAANQQKKKQQQSPSHSFSYDDHVDRTYLEDECGEALGGRIRREHQNVSRIELDQARVEHQGSMLEGKGIIHWRHRQPTNFDYTCYFDKSGRVMDSAYKYY